MEKKCALNSDCSGGVCTAGICGVPKAAADWRKSLEAFAAVVSVVLVAIGVLLYFLWWKNISITGGAIAGSTKRDLEMNAMNSSSAGPAIEEPKDSGDQPKPHNDKLEVPDVAPTEEVHKEGENEEVYVS